MMITMTHTLHLSPTMVSDEQLPEEYDLGVNEEKTGLLVYEVPEDSKDYSISYLEQFSNDTEGDVFFVFFTAKDK